MDILLVATFLSYYEYPTVFQWAVDNTFELLCAQIVPALLDTECLTLGASLEVGMVWLAVAYVLLTTFFWLTIYITRPEVR